MALAARSVLNARGCMHSGASQRSQLRGIRCCATRNSVEVSCSNTRVLFPPRIAIPSFEVEEEDDLEELTFVDYDDKQKPSSTTWLSPQYLDLRLRCSSLMKSEASDALARHFKGRNPVAPIKPATDKILKFPDSTKEQQQPSQIHLVPLGGSYVRPLSAMEFIKECIISDTQNEYFQDLTVRLPTYNNENSTPSTSLEEAFMLRAAAFQQN